MEPKSAENAPLWHGTRDLHHACEHHPVGASMSRGDVCEQWWADWLATLAAAHELIDPELDPRLQCLDGIRADLAACGLAPRPNKPAERFVRALSDDPKLREAAQYVLTGAQLMGGQVMRKRIGSRLPKKHLELSDRREMVAVWSPMRERDDLVHEARTVFSYLLAIMQDIVATDNGTISPNT